MNILAMGFSIIALAFLLILGWYVVDDIITKKRVEISQRDWDEYSKNMTYRQASDAFLDWLKMHQQEKGWNAMYIPQFKHVPPIELQAQSLFRGYCPYNNEYCTKWTCSDCEINKAESLYLEDEE